MTTTGALIGATSQCSQGADAHGPGTLVGSDAKMLSGPSQVVEAYPAKELSVHRRSFPVAGDGLLGCQESRSEVPPQRLAVVEGLSVLVIESE